LKLKTMALSWNAHEVLAMRSFASDLGVPFHHDSLLNPRVDCGANRNPELQLTARESVALDAQDEQAFARLVAHAENVVRPRPHEGPEQPLYSCGAGLTGFTVDPHGGLQLCQLSRKNTFDLREKGFDEGWNSYFPALRARTWQTSSLCRTCDLIGLCGSCPGAAEMEHGDPEAQVAAFCEIAHERAFATLGEAAGHRRDATCCLGTGRLAPDPSSSRALGGCGGCGHSHVGGGAADGNSPPRSEPVPAPAVGVLIRELRVVRHGAPAEARSSSPSPDAR
jgi:radical SAM protein with 4Fe4S-binding SPASM domain